MKLNSILFDIFVPILTLGPFFLEKCIVHINTNLRIFNTFFLLLFLIINFLSPIPLPSTFRKNL